MKQEEILETAVSKAYADFNIPEAEKFEFRQAVSDIFEVQSELCPLNTLRGFIQALTAYADARKKARVSIEDAACYTTEMCLAVQYAQGNTFFRNVVNEILDKGGC